LIVRVWKSLSGIRIHFSARGSIDTLLALLTRRLRKPDGGRVVGPKVFGKSLPRLEALQSTPPFFQLYFLLRLKIREICR